MCRPLSAGCEKAILVVINRGFGMSILFVLAGVFCVMVSFAAYAAEPLDEEQP